MEYECPILSSLLQCFEFQTCSMWWALRKDKKKFKELRLVLAQPRSSGRCSHPSPLPAPFTFSLAPAGAP
eukprot:10369683-Karenia_brevis.AAC.1